MRFVSSFALAALTAACVFAAPAAAQVAGCSGGNLLEAMKASDAALFEDVRKRAGETVNASARLWKVEHAKAKGISYLYATLGVTDERVHQFTPAVQEAFSASRRVAVDVSRVGPRRFTEGFNVLHNSGKLVLKDGSHLAAHLTPAEQQVTNEALAKSGLARELIGRVQPWVAAVLVGGGECEAGRRRSGKLSTNAFIAAQAERRGLGTVDLETVEVQFEALAGLPQDVQMALLKARVAMAPLDDELNETLVQLYLAKDLGAIWPLQSAIARKAGMDAAALEVYRERVVAERARRFGNRLHHHLLRGGVFVAVDQSLMVGADGLVAQLMASEGFTVTAIE